MLEPRTFARDLLRWYDAAGVAMPWRGERDPYRVWLSEVMLQQTQIATVIPYYQKFLERYPTVADLAAAPLDDVLKMWEGLGYYSRARNLHRAARQIIEQHGFPKTASELETLPGIGRYTAAAIASIAHGERTAVLDGNVVRVLARLYDLPDDVTLTATQTYLWKLADALIHNDRPGAYNQAMMDLGREICKPRKPRCAACPVRDHCTAFANDTQLARPVKAKRAPTPHYDVAAGVVYALDGRILIAQRPLEGLLGGLWEFPGGKVEVGETLPECLRRELREELAIEVTVGEQVAAVRHAFTHFRITLYAFEARIVSGEPQAIGCAAWRWVTLAEIDAFAFGKADLMVLRTLRERTNQFL